MPKTKNRPKNAPKSRPKAAAPAQAERSPAVFFAALAALIVAVIASGMLVLQHLGGLSLPGCGEGSGCAALASSAWGKVPGIGWPVSHVGLAYFVSMAIAWLVTGRRVPAALLWVIRLGAVLSAMFIVAMVIEGHFCAYCLAAHVGNFVFWILAEQLPRAEVPAGRPVAAAAALFLVSTAALFGVERTTVRQVQEQAEEDRRESTQQIIEAAGEPEGFTGRYRTGPENAAIRIVILSDYQCPDCRRIELQARQILEERDDVSLSAKHFPMSSQCNPYWTGNDIHPNACWAARAAETAGRLRGNDGFWVMHHWLFDRRGSFTRDELIAYLQEQEYDVDEFLRIMNSQEMLDLVLADIEEGRSLGLHFTPMVFVNGVEMKGFMAKDALINTVAEVVASNPEPMSPTADVPPDAAQKYIDDWRERPAQRLPNVDEAWTRGPDDAKVEIVVWGDLQEPNTAELDARIRRAIVERGDVQYRFLHYPMNDQCNPGVQRSIHPLACLAAKAAEAAGALDGVDGYWRMHDWLMDNREGLTPQQLTQ
ncbi:MAG: thioredoxin domain-containing protein, partial [Planctomycetota bacterium]